MSGTVQVSLEWYHGMTTATQLASVKPWLTTSRNCSAHRARICVDDIYAHQQTANTDELSTQVIKHTPVHHRSTCLGHLVFSVSGPRLWNSLQFDLWGQCLMQSSTRCRRKKCIIGPTALPVDRKWRLHEINRTLLRYWSHVWSYLKSSRPKFWPRPKRFASALTSASKLRLQTYGLGLASISLSYYVIGHFLGKNRVKFGNFVHFSDNNLKSYVVNHYLVLFS